MAPPQLSQRPQLPYRQLPRKSHPNEANAVTLVRLLDELLNRPRGRQLPPEPRYFAAGRRGVLGDVVEPDQPTLAHERAVHLKILLDALVRVIAVDEQEIQHLRAENLTDALQRFGIM